MRFYRLTKHEGDERPTWHATREGAHESMRPIAGMFKRIELVEIATDKPAILAILNGDVDRLDQEVVTTWAMTPRGGLREVPAGE
jgi:predicted NAD/FAD-binding protein